LANEKLNKFKLQISFHKEFMNCEIYATHNEMNTGEAVYNDFWHLLDNRILLLTPSCSVDKKSVDVDAIGGG
jgi:hypothetical protein